MIRRDPSSVRVARALPAAVAMACLAAAFVLSGPASAFSFFGMYWETKKDGLYEAVALGIPGSDIQEAFEQHAKDNLEVIRFEGYEADGKPFFNIVFRKPRGGPWVARHGLTGAQYQSFFNDQVAKGRCLQSLDIYRAGGQPRYVAVFKKKGCRNQQAYHGLTASQHNARFKELTKQGWAPVNVSVAEVGGKRIYAAFYQKRSGPTVLNSSLTAEQLSHESRVQHGQGRKLVYLNAYTTAGGQVRFSAIWRQARDARVSVGGQETAGLISVADQAQGRGLYTRYATGYGVGGTHRFHVALVEPRG